MTASSILSLIAPQYDSTTGRTDFLTLAALSVNTCIFGDKVDLATAYLAAHMIALNTDPARQSGEAGAVTSKKEGDLSISFSNGRSTNEDLGQTSFGRQFLNLQNGVAPAIYVLGTEICDG